MINSAANLKSARENLFSGKGNTAWIEKDSLSFWRCSHP